MPVISREAEYYRKQIEEKLIGGVITGSVCVRGEDDYGLRVKKDGKLIAVWIQRDGENNGPGCIVIEEIKHKEDV